MWDTPSVSLHGERESRPFNEEPDNHLYFNQHYTSAPGLFYVMHSAVAEHPQPLARSFQLVEVWPYSEKKKVDTDGTGYNVKLRNAERKMWNWKCVITLISWGVIPREHCHSADYHTNLSTGNAEKCRSAMRKILATMPESVFDHECNLEYLANVYVL